MDSLRNNSGFTLVDLLVAAVIILVLFTFVLANFRTSDRNQNLQRTSSVVLSELRGIQIMSKAGQLVGICSSNSPTLCFDDSDCQPSDNCIITSPSGGYGVKIDACSPGACSYQTVARDDQADIIDDSKVKVLRQFELPGDNFFSSVYFSMKEPLDGICPEPSVSSAITGFQVTFPTSAQAAALQFDLIPAPVPAVIPSSVVAIIESDKTGQQRCIFFSRQSGLIGEFEI